MGEARVVAQAVECLLYKHKVHQKKKKLKWKRLMMALFNFFRIFLSCSVGYGSQGFHILGKHFTTEQ
jgi:hypothetical protein